MNCRQGMLSDDIPKLRANATQGTGLAKKFLEQK